MSRGGFTLIEVLVSIAIISVLIAILIPVLGSTRLRAYELKSVSHLRQLGVTTTLYTNAYDSYYFGHGGMLRPNNDSKPGGISFPVWLLDRNWPVLIHRIAPWDTNFQLFISPRTDAKPWFDLMNGSDIYTPLPTSYVYSNSFVAIPGNWNGSSGYQIDNNATRSMRPWQVLYSSGKVLMYDGDLTYLGREKLPTDGRPLLFADGSARVEIDSNATTPVQNRLRPLFNPIIYHDTPMGIKGRDF